MRGYRNQFEKDTVIRIDKIISTLEAMPYPTGTSRYYGLDLVLCLKAGALLGSLQLVMSFMEIYIRGIVISCSTKAMNEKFKLFAVELELENKKEFDFNKLIDALVYVNKFDKQDSNIAKRLYKEVRIPTHHGLPARLLKVEEENRSLEEIFGVDYVARSVSINEFEEFIEDEALNIIEEVVSLLERNQHA